MSVKRGDAKKKERRTAKAIRAFGRDESRAAEVQRRAAAWARARGLR